MPDKKPYLFINYRWEDTPAEARRLYSELGSRLAPNQVFFDAESVQPGEVWAERVLESVSKATVVFALVGSRWLTLQHPTYGIPRIFDAEDWVCRELEIALNGDQIVIPLLVDDTDPIQPAVLSVLPRLGKLPRLKTGRLRRDDWEADVAALLAILKTHGFRLVGEATDLRLTSEGPDEPEALEMLRDKMDAHGLNTTEIDSRISYLKSQSRKSSGPKKGVILGKRFELREKIGEGGFGTVWQALDKSSKDLVAVKLLHDHLTRSEDNYRLFFRGGSLMQRATHAHIVNVRHRPIESGGYCWFAMEYLPEGNLRDAVERGSMTREQIIEILEDVADALEHVWTNEKCFHLDVKPTNILLDAKGRGKLADFDLVKAPNTVTLTMAVGDVVFGAPEVLGKRGKPTRRSDVYSLGATALYALSGGEVPILGDDLTLDKALKKAELIGSAAGAVRRALSADPEQRFESAAKFVKALQAAPPTVNPAARELWYRFTPGAGWEQLAETYIALEKMGHPPDRRQFFDACGRPPDDKVPKIDFIDLEGGTFLMGSPEGELERRPNEGPQHDVTVPRFQLAATAVTHEQFRAFDPDHEVQVEGVSAADMAQHPIVNVNWWQAFLYCRWIGARLPSEAEWEYACRAGTTTPFSTGKNVSTEHVNYRGDGPYGDAPKSEHRGRTVPVRTFLPNAWGLFEMHGNVWEWCADTWCESYRDAAGEAAARTKEGDGTMVARAGSWYNPAHQARSAYRLGWFKNVSTPSLGFRPARSWDGLQDLGTDCKGTGS